jgi:ceramide glucosyltransferase
MIRILFDLGLFGLVTSTIFAILVLAGLLRFLRQRQPAPSPATAFSPAVSLLKPLDGTEPDLEAHLESFFDQDYPQFEILFCARSAADPGLEAARRVAARYPKIPTRFLSTGEDTYINAKVSSLELMYGAARHNIFIVSDSDVRVARNYIREVVAPFADEKVGAVTCLYRGVADRGLWSKLEAAGMSVEMTSGVLTANLLEGMKFALGPTMAVRRSCVQAMGGFGVLGPYCSDDFLLGAKVAEQGETVVLSHHVIDHIILNLSFAASLRHQTRWMKSTRFSRPLGHLGTALTFSVPFGILACLAGFAMHRPVPRAFTSGLQHRESDGACGAGRTACRAGAAPAAHHTALPDSRLARPLLLGGQLRRQHDPLARATVSAFARRPDASCRTAPGR